MFFIPLAALTVRSAEAGDYFNRGSGQGLSGLVRDLRSGDAEFPALPPPEPVRRASAPVPEATALTGFLTRFRGEFYVGSNLYFTHRGKSYLIEDFTGLQKFYLKSKDLHAVLKEAGDFRIGEIGIEPSSLKENERVSFELSSKLEASTVFYNWKLPKITYKLVAGITGFGFVRQVTERTEKIISLKTPEGQVFCYYQNIPGRVKGVLYPALPRQPGCR